MGPSLKQGHLCLGLLLHWLSDLAAMELLVQPDLMVLNQS